MIKHIIILTASTLVSLISISQTTPQGISYQAVARNADGEVLVNADLNVQIGILMNAMDGELRYQEIHATTTNAFGLFSLIIGEGVDTGEGSLASFTDNTWKEADHFFQVAIDPGDGTYLLIGTSQFLSVPYAFHSSTSEVANFALNVTNVDDADADPENEKVTLFELTGSIITLEESGETYTIDIPDEVNDADADPTNEQISEVIFADNTLTITESGVDYEVTIPDAVDDADSDPNNESLSNVQITDNTLSITESGVTHMVALPVQEPDLDWNISDGVVYNTTNDIGIGTNYPTSTLQVDGSMSHNVKYIIISADEILELTELDHTVIVELDGANIAIVLPSASTCLGREYYIKAVATSASPSCIISCDGFSIDNNIEISLTGLNKESVHVISAGENGWWILD